MLMLHFYLLFGPSSGHFVVGFPTKILHTHVVELKFGFLHGM